MVTAITGRPEDRGTSSGNTELESVGRARIALLESAETKPLEGVAASGLEGAGVSGIPVAHTDSSSGSSMLEASLERLETDFVVLGVGPSWEETLGWRSS